ncbi:MAG: lipid-A-disaccharide synthase [Candidatus Dadabacteria bacterium]
MKYYIIAGEASGDLHGSNLIRELLNLDKGAIIRCWGGGLMEQAGGKLVKHYEELAFMGFIEVIKNLPTIIANMKFCKKDIQQFAPDVLVLIDYPGFNLRMAKWAKEAGYKVIYYISPQVWAWKENRVKLIKRVVDKMLVILPFEKEFYHNWDYNVVYVGHPLVQVVEERLNDTTNLLISFSPSNENIGDKTARSQEPANKDIIALLPGSRKQEIMVKLPIMLEASKQFPQYDFIISQAPSQPIELYNKLLTGYPNIKVAFAGQTYTLLKKSTAALVTSGTATLETALFGVPQVVCYKGSAISYQIAKRLISIKYISLVNLIMDKPVVTELIQNDLTVSNIVKELNAILYDASRLTQMREDYDRLRKQLKQNEGASARAAQEIVDFLQSTS